MKQFLHYTSVKGYLFWGKSNPLTLKRCISQYRRHFSAVMVVQSVRCRVLNNSILVSEKQEKIYVGHRFLSGFPSGNDLMDFDVWPRPSLLRSLRNLYYFFFTLKNLDESFSLDEFKKSTAIALEVVTTLLSELRFTELDGLLTEDCRESVEKNLRTWSRDQVAVLAVKPKLILSTSPAEVLISENEERTFVEIRVIHYVWLKYSSKFEMKNESAFPKLILKNKFDYPMKFDNEGDLYMCGVFNSKFIREYTKGCTDEWIINAINLKCWSNILTRF